MYVRVTSLIESPRPQILEDRIFTPGERFRFAVTHDDIPSALDAICTVGSLIAIEAIETIAEEPWESDTTAWEQPLF